MAMATRGFGNRNHPLDSLSFVRQLLQISAVAALSVDDIGPALVALAALDRPLGVWSKPIIVFGRVPLFFYLLPPAADPRHGRFVFLPAR